MTKRITISLPDDVAAYVERSGANNTSGYIADILRRKMRADSFRAQLAERGIVITDEDLDRMRARLAALPRSATRGTPSEPGLAGAVRRSAHDRLVNGLVLDTSALLRYASGTSIEPGSDADTRRGRREPGGVGTGARA